MHDRDILTQLDELTALHSARSVTQREYEDRRDEILKSVQAKLDALKDEYQPLLDAADERISDLEATIKASVTAHGVSVRHRDFHAIYSRPRVSWDTKALDGYAASHPEIRDFRKEGKPSVSLRRINQAE
ncbi:MAG: hypothetical protein GFH27_549279n321 [Chloroflexi bacterium AL-W]|nr:hypothetical protein [Chloroflexi bacterium AL-N1]NOK65287.1 hypothetical protein [Chloroflexi bacterium AL-N10]NOK72448.1 hypothetical protein [Chloroflexi bacterium AL-N5]NOK79466.1 hypothetical protein [Chloroflexi bacterium AL-W]NOK87382.1 hypothetical protein [Chloroflexi bacterium AL-N15]